MRLEIEYIPVGELKPYEKNARKHATEDVKAIVESIKEFGFDDPIGIWKDTIVEGHGRLMAAKKLGMKEVPVIRLDHLTDEQRRAYALAHNRTAELSTWDFELRDLEIEAIDIDMSRFGFDSKKAREDNYDVNVPDEPKAKLGEIYQLGIHRLMCGDSTSEDDVVKLCNGESIDMLLTDPPYNVNYTAGKAGTILNDNMKNDDFRAFLHTAFRNAKKVMRGGAAFHIWYSDSEVVNFRGACADAGLLVRQHLVWVKSQATLGRQDFQRQYEQVLSGFAVEEEEEESGYNIAAYGWKDGPHRWLKKRKEKDVLFFDKPTSSAEHPTMKPVLLFDYEMRCNTRPGDNVLDLFGGSGTTIIAAEQNGRRAFVMEYDPRFVDVIIDRWETFTGEKAHKE